MVTKKQIIFIFILFLLWFSGFVAFNHRINDFEIDDTQKADAIVVLTGGRNRLKEAVKLLNNKKADKMFVSGVFKDTSLKALQKRKDVEIINSENITLDKKSTNTVENAIEASSWVKDNKIKSIYLVTSNYHMPRSMAEFNYRNPKLEIISYPVYSDKVSKEWWKSWRTFTLLAGEYNKFLYVLLSNSLVIEKEN
ncbi:MAG: YdcF family protein [Alphaproteobacteria bacterium]|nr:YdcF family protein [Alphaproteobacteria bacterium]